MEMRNADRHNGAGGGAPRQAHHVGEKHRQGILVLTELFIDLSSCLEKCVDVVCGMHKLRHDKCVQKEGVSQWLMSNNSIVRLYTGNFIST